MSDEIEPVRYELIDPGDRADERRWIEEIVIPGIVRLVVPRHDGPDDPEDD